MVSGGILGSLSDDTLVEIFGQLAPRERARFSAVNKRLYSLLHPWTDINRITAHKEGIVLASEHYILEVQGIGSTKEKDAQPAVHVLASALHASPFVRKLVISSVEHIRTVPATAFSYLSNIRELTLPCDIFDKKSNLNDKIEAIFAIKRLLVLRILKRFDTPRRAYNIIRAEHVQKLQANDIRMLKLQGVSLTAAAMEAISKKYSHSLKYLCLMGALVHTPDAAIYLRALCNLKNLNKLTLPPSLLSLSSKPLYSECRILRQLTVKYLGVFVYESEIVETRYFIKKLLPDTLKELCLHDPTHLVSRDLKNDEFRKLHFKVTFCQRPDSLYQQDWMHNRCELLSHMVWIPPYKHFSTEYPHPVPGWWFFMSEDVDTAEENSEITATEVSPTAQPQPATHQLRLPPNEDPNEMMMATIARFFERMIDDQLSADFGGGGGNFPDLGGFGNLASLNNDATPNTTSQMPVPAAQNGSRSQLGPGGPPPRRRIVVISTGGRGGLSRPHSGRTPTQTTGTRVATVTTPTPTPSSTAVALRTSSSASRTTRSPESEESEDDSSSSERVLPEPSTTTTTTTTAPTTTTTASTSSGMITAGATRRIEETPTLSGRNPESEQHQHQQI